MLDRKYENKSITIREEVINPGENKLVQIYIDRLPTGTEIHVPVYVFNGKEAGPTVLIQGGLHGDEVNGTELVRRMLVDNSFEIKKGCAIVIPLLNVFGFISFSREVYGKDVNRNFPGSKTGSMASRIAHKHMKEVVSKIDFGIDFHTGGGQRSNYPQIRYTEGVDDSKYLAELFNAPFVFPSTLIAKSIRNEANKKGIPIIVFEGGESLRIDEDSIREGIEGTMNILHHFGLIDQLPKMRKDKADSIHLSSRKWVRAQTSGIFNPSIKNGSSVKKDQVIGHITDTYGETDLKVKAPYEGYIIALNNYPVVNQGDALFHIGK